MKNGHVLLHRLHTDTNWSLPGGRVAMGEDSRTTLTREMNEELGIDVHVERMLWTVENFFTYTGRNYHEIGLYYLISCNDKDSLFTTDSFHGLEGERLIYQWTPITELEELPLYPAFLRTSLKQLPSHPEHLVVRQ